MGRYRMESDAMAGTARGQEPGPAFADRAAFLDHVHATRRSIGKHEFVVQACVGRSVLDIGCVDHDADNAFGASAYPWLHREITAVASRTLGLDRLEADV